MPKHPSADPYVRAEELLRRLDIRAVPVPVERIAKALHAHIRFAPLDNEISGMIFVKHAVPIIGVNSLHHPNRQRFTIAHELGHLELHRDMITSRVHVDKTFPVLMRDSKSATGTEEKEIEANRFAAALLMPEGALDTALEGKPFDIDEYPLDDVAKKFGVSRQALEYRLRNLS